MANLAATLGDAGVRMLVVDCDHRKPAVGKYLDPALILDEPTKPTATRLHNVSFLPPPHAEHDSPDVLPQLIATIREVRADFDMVLLDTPPMLMMNDAIGLLPEADGVVLVVRAGQTRIGQAERAVNLIERFRATQMGVVLNSCSARDAAHRYGYGYYHSHRSGSVDRRPAPPDPTSETPEPDTAVAAGAEDEAPTATEDPTVESAASPLASTD